MDKSRDKIRHINWKLWIGLLISAVAIYLAFKKIDLVSLWKDINGCSIYYLILAALINLFQLVIRAWHWKIHLGPIKKTAFSNRFPSVIIGFAANCVLLVRLREFTRADNLGQMEQVSRSSTFATIVVERLFDGFTLLLILLIGLMCVPFPKGIGVVSASLQSMGIALFVFYVLIIIFLIGFRLRSERYPTILNKILFPLPSNLKIKMLI